MTDRRDERTAAERVETSAATAPPRDPAAHDLGHRLLDDVRTRAKEGGGEGLALAEQLGKAAEALHLEIVDTGLRTPHALAGHVIGMRLLLPAGGIHGPRETPTLVYLFGDALALRPTDDAPMSSLPLLGLHLVLPDAAIAHWLYNLGRTAHANLELLKDEEHVAASLPSWTVEDFADADPKLKVFHMADLRAPVHLYEELGFVRIRLPAADKPVRLKSTLPESTRDFVNLWKLFDAVGWPGGLSMAHPGDEPGAARSQRA